MAVMTVLIFTVLGTNSSAFEALGGPPPSPLGMGAGMQPELKHRFTAWHVCVRGEDPLDVVRFRELCADSGMRLFDERPEWMLVPEEYFSPLYELAFRYEHFYLRVRVS